MKIPLCIAGLGDDMVRFIPYMNRKINERKNKTKEDKIKKPVITVSFRGYKPLTRNVNTDFYTGKQLRSDRRSIEHLLPKSKGGLSNFDNYAVTDKDVNAERGNMSIVDWLKIHPDYLKNMKRYVKRYLGLIIGGKSHGRTVAETVNKDYSINLLA